MIITTAFFSVPEKVKAQDSPPVTEAVNLELGGYQLLTPTPKVNIEIVESEFQKKNRLSEESLPLILKTIRYCESKDNYLAENRRSTASGAYQALDGTFNNYQGYARAKDAPKYVQDQFALELYQRRGTSPWNASKSCWQPNVRVASNSNGEITILAGYSSAYTNCYGWVASQRYIPQTRNGRANTTPTNSSIPVVGAVAVFYYNHVGLVAGIEGETIVIKDANYKRGYLTLRRVNKSEIKGFYI